MSGPGKAAGVRVARICPKCKMRVFGKPGWVCPEHGVAEVQKNRPYMGQPVPGGKDGTDVR